MKQGKFSILTERYLTKTIDCAIDCFMKKEHITKVFEMSYDDLYPLVSWLCNVSMQEGLGYIAYDEEADAIIGFALAKRSSTEFTTQLNEKMKVIENISNVLMDKAFQLPFAKEEFCHLLFIGFINDNTKKNDIKFLAFIKYVMENIKQYFTYVYMECTNTRSQKIAKFYGSTLLHELHYHEISSSYQNKNPNPQEIACMSYLKKL